MYKYKLEKLRIKPSLCVDPSYWICLNINIILKARAILDQPNIMCGSYRILKGVDK